MGREVLTYLKSIHHPEFTHTHTHFLAFGLKRKPVLIHSTTCTEYLLCVGTVLALGVQQRIKVSKFMVLTALW